MIKGENTMKSNNALKEISRYVKDVSEGKATCNSVKFEIMLERAIVQVVGSMLSKAEIVTK
jgi:hypothetical protein